jgi:hypothetical protein
MPLVQIPTFPFYAIFILVLIISANFLAQLVPCRFQRALQTNMYIKHLFGLLTLNFFVLLSMPELSSSLYEGVKSSVLLYAAFMIITRTDATIFYLILFLLGVSYLVRLNIDILVKKTEKHGTVVMILQNRTLLLYLIRKKVIKLSHKKIKPLLILNTITRWLIILTLLQSC